MFIAIIGTRLSGKSTVQDYLVGFKGFQPVQLIEGDRRVSIEYSFICPDNEYAISHTG